VRTGCRAGRAIGVSERGSKQLELVTGRESRRLGPVLVLAGPVHSCVGAAGGVLLLCVSVGGGGGEG